MSDIPQHIGIIMDGNRRWAKLHGLSVLRGHEYVASQVIEQLVKEAIAQDVKYLTLWAFSTENWHRDQEEVSGLMHLFREAFRKNAAELHKYGVRLLTVGDISRFPQDIQENIATWEAETANNTAITVVFALNYGGRNEIVRSLASMSASGEAISESNISAALDTGRQHIPDPDLIIRPGGEIRLSGLYPWQAVYAELYFTPTLMPDFGPAQLREALAEYSRRHRRFGT